MSSPTYRILRENTSLTGKELRDLTGLEELSLWRECRRDPRIETRIAGKRYLRLDRRVKGYARLSPSIKREFLTYTICGLKDNLEEIEARTRSLVEDTRDISRKKLDFSRQTLTRIVQNSKNREEILARACFIIAGDIVYEMAHLEPRPESSTGRLVRGSDLDIIIVTENDMPEEIVRELDQDIYNEKYLCLVKPEIREEIDYIIKDMDRTRSQMSFDTFEHMVAAKIFWEGELLYGSPTAFDAVKSMLDEFSIPERLERLTEEAGANRDQAESFLLEGMGTLSEEECLKLFYTREEADEIF